MQMGDTVFMFFCALLVWLMTPGLALFYGGLVRSKNVLSTTMHSLTSLAIVSIVWIMFGYSLAFAPGNAWIGGLDWIGLKGVGFEPGSYSETIPHSLFMMFQMTFAVLTTAIISGAFAERIRYSAVVVFTLLWVTFVYAPVAHWVWGGGWIGEMGALDFAGGNVVHISSGVAGLVVAIVLGKRKEATNSSPHNLIYTLLGGAVIWFGWFGFNVGSALTLDSVAMYAFINTNTVSRRRNHRLAVSRVDDQQKAYYARRDFWSHRRSCRDYTCRRFCHSICFYYHRNHRRDRVFLGSLLTQSQIWL